MARCGCGTASSSGTCNCALSAGTNVSVTGGGTFASPWIVNAITNCAEVRACLSAGPGITYTPATGVIRVCVSPNAGNSLTQDANGCLFVSPGNNSVTTGCGINGDGTAGSPLTAAVSTWGNACADTNGMRVYCASDGLLRTEPASTTQVAHAAGGATQNIPDPGPTCGTFSVISQRLNALTFTNPSACRDMAVSLEFGGRLRADMNQDLWDAATAGVATGVNVLGEYRINGGPWINWRNATWNGDPSQNLISAVGGDHDFLPAQVTVAPGAAIVIDTRISVTCANVNRAIRYLINEPSINASGVTT